MHADQSAITKVYVRRESPAPTEFTPDEQECLQSLFFIEMHWRRNDVADPAPATCAWLMKHPIYCEWLDQRHGLLWIKGNPGTGKSTVLKHALETAEQFPKQTLILASFFFHGRGAPNQKSTLGLFRSLLHQILQQNRDLLSKFTRLYKMRCQTNGKFGDKWEWQANELQNFFKSKVVSAARTQQIRIYIDALDECGEDVAIDLVEFFRCFAPPISICFSCRHYPFVALEGGDEICVEDENERDIEIYVQEKIEAHIHRTDIAKTLHNEVVSRSQGNFQWVVLVIPRVLTLYKSRKSIAAIQAMIQNTPTELHELYTGLLSLIEDHERSQSLHFMQWICFSFEPLTLRELRFALIINPDISHTSIHQCQDSEFYVDTDEDLKPVVYDLSKGLAEVQEYDGEPIVQFIHQSVQDYLLDKGFQVLDYSIAGNVIGHGHLWISRSCIEYLSMEEVQASAVSLSHKRKERFAKIERSDYLSLFSYSSTYWLSHIQWLEDANMSQDDLAALSIKTSDVTLHKYFFRYLRYNGHVYDYDETTLLHIAIEHNDINVTRAVLTQTVRADQTNGQGQTSLSIAAKEGHAILVELLLGRDDVDADHRDAEQNTPLSLAAASGHEAVVGMLVNRDDVDMNHKNVKGETPLSSAAREGHEAVVRLLLNKEAVDVNYKDVSGETPLFLAATEGYEAVVEVLMNREDVDLNSVNGRGDTPLSKAAEYGRTATVRMLLVKENVDLNHKNLQGNTPLLLAARNGRTAVVEVLLQGNANANIRGSVGRMPLNWAAYCGHYDVVELLLQHNADIDVRDQYDATPLSLAAFEGRYEVVKLLLQRTSSADSIDNSGRTPLSYACSGGDAETVKEFLKRSDVDVNSRDMLGISVLSWAIEGYFSVPTNFEDPKDIVDLLLSRDDILMEEADEEAVKMFKSEERYRSSMLT